MAGTETDPRNPTAPRTDAQPASSAAPLVTAIISSFALVLVAMMLATGVAQRAALPRLQALVSRFEKRPSGESSSTTANADSASAPRVSLWTPESDSLSLIREEIAMAMAELEASRARIAGEGTATGEPGPAPEAALADSAARRDLVRLVKVLDAMKPDAAARVLNSVDDDLAIEAIRRLRERQAGRVLALLTAEKAASVSLALGRGAERAR